MELTKKEAQQILRLLSEGGPGSGPRKKAGHDRSVSPPYGTHHPAGKNWKPDAAWGQSVARSNRMAATEGNVKKSLARNRFLRVGEKPARTYHVSTKVWQ